AATAGVIAWKCSVSSQLDLCSAINCCIDLRGEFLCVCGLAVSVVAQFGNGSMSRKMSAKIVPLQHRQRDKIFHRIVSRSLGCKCQGKVFSRWQQSNDDEPSIFCCDGDASSYLLASRFGSKS